MAEPKRVEFKTVSSVNGDKNEKKRTLTQRFVLSLSESTASTCPEFSFTELVKKEKGGSDDPFGDEDNHSEVAAIAKKLEEKYGPKPRKKIKCLEDDDFDLGEGYDENDPFIDNTEAYDEVVPKCLTTMHGGFYINRGTLDFKTLSEHDDSCEEFTPSRKRGRPKKILDSGSEQDEENEQKKKKIKRKKIKDGIEGEKKRRKKVLLASDGETIKRRKSLDPEKRKKTSPTVAELLKQQTASTSTTSAVANGNADDDVPHVFLQNLECRATEKLAALVTTEAAVLDTPHEDPTSERRSDSPEVVNLLPTGLPSTLASTIDNIKQAARESKEGKCKFFSGNINNMLLDIELASRQLPCGHRSLIYAHLADHLPCGKETLIKRAKKLRENQQDNQLKVPLQRLKDAIGEVMPVLQEQHEQDVLKARMENKEKGEDVDVAKDEGGNTESDDDEKPSVAGNSEKPNRKGNRGPRKVFKWSPEIRKLLCSIVSIKMQMFETFRIRNQTAEDYLRTFLENEVKHLWPQGWMQTRMLFKESRAVHGKWTNPPKPKKTVLMTKSAASPQPSASGSVENTPEGKAARSSEGATNVMCDVIELSDNDEQMPSSGQNRDPKLCAVPATIDIPPVHFLSRPTDILNTSPNTLQAAAAATAAAVAAAVSVPKSDVQSSVGDLLLKETLVTEILKGTSVSFPFPGKSMLGHSTTPSPAASQTHQNESFMAEYDRFLSIGGRSQIPPSTQQELTSLQKAQMKLQKKQQLQSKVVSSSVSKSDVDSDHSKQAASVQWHMESLLTDSKAHKSVSGFSSSLPNNSSSRMAASTSASPLVPSYKKMYSLLQNSESQDGGPVSREQMVPELILSQIQAKVDVANKLKGIGKTAEHSSKKNFSGTLSNLSSKFPIPTVVLSRQMPSTSSTISLMSPPSASQRQMPSSVVTSHGTTGSVKVGSAQTVSHSPFPPTDISNNAVISQDNIKHKTAASDQPHPQHSPTSSLSVTQNWGGSNVSLSSEFLSKKGSPLAASSGSSHTQVSFQRTSSQGQVSPNSSQSHSNRSPTKHISPASRSTGLLSGPASQSHRSFLSAGQNTQSRKSPLTGQPHVHGTEAAHRLSTSGAQNEASSKSGASTSMAPAGDGNSRQVDVTQRLFEQQPKTKIALNKHLQDLHLQLLDLHSESLIESHKLRQNARALEHHQVVSSAGTVSSKRNFSAGMPSQWPASRSPSSPTVVSPSVGTKSAGRVFKTAVQSSSSGLPSVAAPVPSTESGVPQPAHMGATKSAGQAKPTPPPAHGGLGSQGQMNTQQAAAAATFFNRQQAGPPAAHLSHAFTRPPFEDSSCAPSEKK